MREKSVKVLSKKLKEVKLKKIVVPEEGKVEEVTPEVLAEAVKVEETVSVAEKTQE